MNIIILQVYILVGTVTNSICKIEMFWGRRGESYIKNQRNILSFQKICKIYHSNHCILLLLTI